MLLARVLDNLVSNAIKYSNAGPIFVDAINDERHATVTVRDSGPGISISDQAHLFEPFFRSSEARKLGIGGNGLGLAIASRIAAGLGGSLSVESHPGCGSCFIWRLPRCS